MDWQFNMFSKLRESYEKHPIFWAGSILVAFFSAGAGSVLTIEKIANVKVLSSNEYFTINNKVEELQKVNERLFKENSYLKQKLNELSKTSVRNNSSSIVENKPEILNNYMERYLSNYANVTIEDRDSSNIDDNHRYKAALTLLDAINTKALQLSNDNEYLDFVQKELIKLTDGGGGFPL